MKVCIDGEIVEAPDTEFEARRAEYWRNVNYDDAVDFAIRANYTISQEFAILRQKDEKPEEYKEYFDFCEQCKAHVKEMIKKYTGV